MLRAPKAAEHRDFWRNTDSQKQLVPNAHVSDKRDAHLQPQKEVHDAEHHVHNQDTEDTNRCGVQEEAGARASVEGHSRVGQNTEGREAVDQPSYKCAHQLLVGLELTMKS